MAEAKICTCPQCGKKFKVSAKADAASFACSQCAATVWIDGKPRTPATGRHRPTGGGRSGGTKAGGRTRASAKKGARAGGKRTAGGATAARGQRRGQGRGRGREEAAEEEEGHERRGSRYQQQNNSTNVIIAVVGLLALVGGVAFFAMSGDDDKPADTTQEQATNTAGTGMADTDGAPQDPPTAAEDDGPDSEAPVDADQAATPPANAETTRKPTKKLNASKSKYKTVNGKRVRISKYNPPDDLKPHLESTPADKRKEIDKLIDTMFDPAAGRDGFDAKKKLILIGKPAFIPVLQRMVVTKKLVKWDRSLDDNITLSSVRLADEVLREMDGWIEAKNVRRIVPGSDERYYNYVLRIYYRRWLTALKDLDAMPGPYDPAAAYEGENEEKE